jgi:hypothetical protein
VSISIDRNLVLTDYMLFFHISYYASFLLSCFLLLLSRYGDITPKSDEGRLCVAIYAVLSLNVMGGLLDVGREWADSFCRTTVPAVDTSVVASSSSSSVPTKKDRTKQDTTKSKAKAKVKRKET